MATRLGVYNDALEFAGERALATLTENREARRLLDAAWDSHAHKSWLEKTDWNFALRSVKIGKDPSYTAEWGPSSGFQHPEDMVRPAGIYADEHMQVPLRDYLDEGKYWFAEAPDDAIYVQYVSNGASYGGDLGLWPASFAEYVAAFLALKIAPNIKNDVDAESLKKEVKRLKREAQSYDGLRSASKRLPRGGWIQSRLAGSRRDSNYGR